MRVACIVLEASQSCPFELDIVIVVKIVYTYHFVASGKHLHGNMRTDKAGGSRNQYPHGKLPFKISPLLEPAIYFILRQKSFDVINNTSAFAICSDASWAEVLELVMCDGYDYSVVCSIRRSGQQLDAVLLLCLSHVNVWIKYVYRRVVTFELLDNIHNTCIAEVGTVFLECEPKYQDPSINWVEPALQHEPDCLVGDIGPHSIICAPSGQYHVRMMANLLRLIGQVIRIYANAVSAYQPWPEREKVPFSPGSLQYFECIDVQLIEKNGQVVYQCDVEVPLSVLDDFGCFSYTDAACFMGAGRNDTPVHFVEEFSDFRRRARCDLHDVSQAMAFITRIDALRAVTCIEILIEHQSRRLFKYGYANFFRATRENC